MLIIALPVIFILLYYIHDYIKWKNTPPGPFRLPLIGNLVQLMLGPPEPNLAIAKISEKYGDIFRLKVGLKDLIIISSTETIADVFGREETLGRELAGVFFDRNGGQNSGLVIAEGPLWELNRKWTFKTLRSLGLGKTSGVEGSIRQQLSTLMQNWQELCNCGDGIVDMDDHFILYVTKIVWQLLVGDFIKDNDTTLGKLVHVSAEMGKCTVAGAGIANAYPFLRFVLPKLTGHDVQMRANVEIRQVAQEVLNAARKSRCTAEGSTLTEQFLNKIETDQGNFPKEFSTDFNYGTIFMDLVQASSDTTSSYLEGLILFSILNPDSQQRSFEEIYQIVGFEEKIQLEHRRLCPYIEAFLWEVHRCLKLAQNLMPHKVLKEFYYKGYRIPKDVVILADMHSANNDLRIWENPSQFQPERFLDAKGQFCLKKKKLAVPFGVGRRSCPGIELAEMTSFLFFANIIRTFKLSIVPGSPRPRAEMKVGFLSKPYPFKIFISKRK